MPVNHYFISGLLSVCMFFSVSALATEPSQLPSSAGEPLTSEEELSWLEDFYKL